MKNHAFWMIIGCTLPLLLILFTPSFGISEGTSRFVFIIAMFACHLFMMGGHGHHSDDESDKNNKHKGDCH